ncbi:helix-turn-helix domain-containing protein [Rhodococcus qingshengii]|uniref:helix-turn-helix domain-containing protein n=1 Tax=Rhodococcus qingshengii TaxID=334542 RepID=UPI0035D5C3D5
MKALRRAAQTGSTGDPERDLAYAIAQQIHDLRTDQGLSQADLAERSGTKQPKISVAESATRLVTLPLLLRIAESLDTELVITFKRKGEDPT